MPLPGTEDWNRNEIDRMIRFERGTPAAIARLIPLIANANREEGQEFTFRRGLTDAPFALQWAAELAFASDNVDLGLAICADIVNWLRPNPQTPMQWALWATAGALNRQVFTILIPSGALALWTDDHTDRRAQERVRRLGTAPSIDKDIVELTWPESSADAIALGRKLIPAVFSSVGPRGLQSLHTGDTPRRLRIAAETGLHLTDEYRVANFLFEAETATSEDGEVSLRAIEHRYEQRLAFLQASPRWERPNHPIPLIDWGLLGLYLGAIRLKHKGISKRIPPGSAAAFLWQLALRIDGLGRPSLTQ